MKHFGRAGAVATAAACNGLLVRDVVLLVSGATRRLKRGPARLLMLETGLAAVASALSIRVVFNRRALALAMEQAASTPEVVRRIAIAALFEVHTGRYSIYLRPGHGWRPQAGASGAVKGDAPPLVP
jgi:hypothetical protein